MNNTPKRLIVHEVDRRSILGLHSNLEAARDRIRAGSMQFPEIWGPDVMKTAAKQLSELRSDDAPDASKVMRNGDIKGTSQTFR